MPRQPRIEYAGALYHAFSRGDQMEDIFRSDRDRKDFLALLEAACSKTGWQIHAFCLMPNHFHLVLETPRPNLVAGMKWLLGAYTIRFNLRNKGSGHVFAGRYKTILIDDRDDAYLRTVCDYVHLNPARAGLVKPREGLQTYPWSSLALFALPSARRPAWLRTDRLLAEHGVADTPSGRERFLKQTESLRGPDAPPPPVFARMWQFGAPGWRECVLAKSAGGWTESHRGLERHESDLDKAEHIIRDGLNVAGWREEDLPLRRKNDPVKIRIARALRSRTPMPMKWVATRLHMGSWRYATKLLRGVKVQD